MSGQKCVKRLQKELLSFRTLHERGIMPQSEELIPKLAFLAGAL